MIGALVGALCWGGGCAPTEERLEFALKPDKDPDKMLAEKVALEEFLAERLGKPVSVVIPLSGAVILEGLANGTLDVGYISSTEMVQARERESATLMLAGEIDGNPYYSSYWVSLREKPYSRIEDLRGQPVAFSSRSSTSGFVIPFWDLHQKGLVEADGVPEDFFGSGNTWYGVGYVSAIERVLAGDAEAAAVSYYVIDEDRHLSAEQKARLKKVVEQGPVPTHVIAVSTKVDPEEAARIKAALLEFNQESNRELRDKLFTSRLVEVDPDAHLEGISQALNLARNIAR
jgi:phosphonate transport system substrate-binding protein